MAKSNGERIRNAERLARLEECHKGTLHTLERFEKSLGILDQKLDAVGEQIANWKGKIAVISAICSLIGGIIIYITQKIIFR